MTAAKATMRMLSAAITARIVLSIQREKALRLPQGLVCEQGVLSCQF